MKKKNLRFLNIFLITIFLLLTGCGGNTVQYQQPVLTQPLVNTYGKSTEFIQPANEAEFLTILSRYNVSRSDIAEITEFLDIRPNGEWIEGEIGNSAQNLTNHYKKHAYDFKPPFRSEEDYHKAAVRAAASTDPNFEYFLDLRYYNDGMINVVKWNSKTKEFVVMRKDGRLATYFPDNKLAKGRFIRVPMDMRR